LDGVAAGNTAGRLGRLIADPGRSNVDRWSCGAAHVGHRLPAGAARSTCGPIEPDQHRLSGGSGTVALTLPCDAPVKGPPPDVSRPLVRPLLGRCDHPCAKSAVLCVAIRQRVQRPQPYQSCRSGPFDPSSRGLGRSRCRYLHSGKRRALPRGRCVGPLTHGGKPRARGQPHAKPAAPARLLGREVRSLENSRTCSRLSPWRRVS